MFLSGLSPSFFGFFALQLRCTCSTHDLKTHLEGEEGCRDLRTTEAGAAAWLGKNLPQFHGLEMPLEEPDGVSSWSLDSRAMILEPWFFQGQMISQEAWGFVLPKGSILFGSEMNQAADSPSAGGFYSRKMPLVRLPFLKDAKAGL